jgi:PBSX family phage terminase large subunit
VITVKPLEASLFKILPTEVQEALLASGVVPVNDVFYPIWNNRNKINLLYGSYGSGKSVFIVDRLITHAMEDKYFRCYFGRKIFDSVRGSVFKTITDRIKERNLEHFFTFSDAPNGSMNIVCKENGNEFIPFGANNPDSLKSIKDPTHFFCEELDYFSFTDFRFIYTRLRTIKAFTQFYGAFNTDKLFKGHWLRTQFFEGDFKDKCFKLLSTFRDNHLIDQEDYEEKLRIASGGNASVFAAIAGGVMGIIRTGEEFWNQFNETKHIKPIKIDNRNPLHVSVDENAKPYVTQTIWQVFSAEKQIKQVHEIMSRPPNSNAPKAAKELIEFLKLLRYSDVLYVYGDPSGGKTSTVDENNASFFEKYIDELKQADFTVINRVGRSSPRVALSANFINDIYERNYEGWSITIGEHCLVSIEDYIVVKSDENGKMIKPTAKDPDTHKLYETHGHASDTKRYFITTVLGALFDKYKVKGKKFAPKRVN